MVNYILISYDRNDDGDRIALVGTYPTQEEAQQVMKALYDAKLAEPEEWDYEMCGMSGIDAVVQTEYIGYCYRWFIFNSEDTGIRYIFS